MFSSGTWRGVFRTRGNRVRWRPAHKGSDGKLAWDNGGSISNAGYNSQRAEIVATGFPTAADAIQFWMQDDAPSQWGHRNLILNCAIQEAGADHLQGGPSGHYWTVDMGTR